MTKQELKKLNGQLWSLYCEMHTTYKVIADAMHSMEEKVKAQMRAVTDAINKIEKEDGDNETLS